MKVINLFGGPGSGKSTTAALVFAYLKSKHFNVELVREYAKDVVYENRLKLLQQQLYITAKQYKRMKDILDYGQVPLIVTDSPLLLGAYYARKMPYAKSLTDIISHLNSNFEHINVFIKRVKPYNPSGRVQNEAESDAASEYMYENFAPFDYIVNGDSKSIDRFAVEMEKMIIKDLKRKKK